MISNPKYGWCNFQLGDFKGCPSYLTFVPLDLLDAFIDYHKKGTGIAWLDEEGTEFALVITPYTLYVIEEKDEPILHDFSDLKIEELEKELIEDIEKDIDTWIREFVLDENRKTVKLYKKELVKKISILRSKIKE